jgi:hypothetical protein
MKLYFNGCSHTYGDDLKDPKSSAWPSVLSSELDASFLNDSVSGGTNDRIMYRTIKHLDQFDKFYIAWTYTTRFTRYRADNNHDVNFNPRLMHDLYSKDRNFAEYGKIHYQTWHNELYAIKLWLQNIVLLQRLFESVNKPYVMINSVPNYLDRWLSSWQDFNSSVQSLLCFELMHDDQLLAEHTEIQLLVSQINTNNYIGWQDWWLTKAHSICPVGPTGHALVAGHQYIADYIQKHDSYSRPHC